MHVLGKPPHSRYLKRVLCVQKYDGILEDVCSSIFDKWIYQLENTVNNGRNNFHYQGFGHLKQKRRPDSVKSLAISLNGLVSGIEMSTASTAGITALQHYVLKANSRVRGPFHDGSTYIGEDLIVKLYPWQEEIKNSISNRPDPRTINVVIDEVGNTGKSAFCKYMCWHHKIPVLGWGRTGDLLHFVSKLPNKPAYIFDLSRSKPQDWGKDDIAAAMEGIKNGLFINTKYECSQVIMKTPHIWIFTNHVPNIQSMSRDRWRLWKIKHHRLQKRSWHSNDRTRSQSRSPDLHPLQHTPPLRSRSNSTSSD